MRESADSMNSFIINFPRSATAPSVVIFFYFYILFLCVLISFKKKYIYIEKKINIITTTKKLIM